MRAMSYCRCKNGKKGFQSNTDEQNEFTVALAGNPNTGKSTIFNALTGLNQHTGNWPGKTVIQYQGRYRFNQRVYKLVDLPGTYSLFVHSMDEQVARDYICFGKPDAVVVVINACCLERNLNLVLQIMEITPRVIACVNLLDEAKRKNIRIDLSRLAKELGLPAVGTMARLGHGLENLKQTIENLLKGRIKLCPRLPVYDAEMEKEIAGILPQLSSKSNVAFNPRWLALRFLEGDESVLKQVECQTKGAFSLETSQQREQQGAAIALRPFKTPFSQ